MADEKQDNQTPESQEPLEQQQTDAGTATKEAPKKKPARREPGQLPPYKVLLHNDDVNTFEHVIRTVMRLTTLTAEEATLRALEAHNSGLALLLVTHQERAELYQEQFASASLTVTIEPDTA